MVDVSEQVRPLPQWHGQWIWADYVTSARVAHMDRPAEYAGLRPEETNAFVLARHEVTVPPGLARAVLHVTADSRYKVFINGTYVGRGVNRCEAYYWYYDTYDITGFLQPGTNVVAIHGRFYGRDFAYYTRPGGRGRARENAGKGGILFDLALHDADGKVTWEGSGPATRVLRNAGERSQVPLKNDALGFIEDFDSTAVPGDWNEREYDDAGWETPIVLDYPIKFLLPDPNHPLHEERVFPAKILIVGENADLGPELAEEDEYVDFCVQHMLEGPIGPLESFEVTNREALLTGEGACVVTPGPGAAGQVLSLFFKFAREVVGYPRVRVDAPAGTIIDFLPTEKMADTLPRMDWLGNKRGSRVVLRGGPQFFEQWDWEGYCFLLVKVRNLTGPLTIHQLATNVTHMQLAHHGQFKCSEPALDQLWEACAHTLKCCAIDGYLDCPSREQRAYVGDAYPEALVANACFGEGRLTKKLVYDCAFGQRKDGMTYSFHPGDAGIQTHVIPDYCFYWIQLAADYYLYHGDEQVLADLYPHFLRAMDWFWAYVDPETGLLSDLPYWTFIDWSFPHDKPGQWAILNAQFLDVLVFLVGLAEKFGDAAHERKFRTHAERLGPAIDRTFWDATEGCYRDYKHHGQLHGISFMTNAYLVLKGVTVDEEKIRTLVRRVFEFESADEHFRQQIDAYYLKRQSHHAFGDALKDRVVVAQPFFMHHVNQFFAKVGRYDLLGKFLHKWLPMLELGPTGTIWETWSIDGSECHAWAATPAFDLSTHVLGVRPLAAGFAKVEIAPHFLDLAWARGTFPTCQGPVEVSWQWHPDHAPPTAEVAVTVPAGVPTQFTPPIVPGLRLARVFLDGRLDPEPGIGTVELTAPHVTVKLEYARE